MTRKQTGDPPLADDAPVEVRALCDLPAFGASAGRLAFVPPGLVPELRAAGKIDSAPAAVEYALTLESTKGQ